MSKTCSFTPTTPGELLYCGARGTSATLGPPDACGDDPGELLYCGARAALWPLWALRTLVPTNPGGLLYRGARGTSVLAPPAVDFLYIDVPSGLGASGGRFPYLSALSKTYNFPIICLMTNAHFRSGRLRRQISLISYLSTLLKPTIFLSDALLQTLISGLGASGGRFSI